MSVTIELDPKIEADYAAKAAAQGVPLPQYLQRLLEGRTGAANTETLSPGERAAFWRASVAGLPDTTPLSDEAISRAGLYDARG